ncbi:sulfatase family protein [Halomontanus rarus]|uniref:sulfatase family protein n=1 Tax=Halomontanus rarus TaxID=3034020 RepID=UPI0023E77723|nr:sulfatase-like hydrolase/transferase [Halovivax sp. TS33]
MRILYIDCDSLRPDHLGCYGYHRDTSPTIDSLAADGRRFTNYYVSDAPCLPSRTAYFTGRFGFHTGAINHRGINADIRHQGAARGDSMEGPFRTLPRAFRNEGYQTTLISPFPQRHGAFHVVDGFDEWCDTGGGGTERAEVVYPYAEQWLDEHATEEDWYLHVNFWDPHTPYDTPEEYGNPFADDPAPEFPDEATIQEHYDSYGPHSAQDLHHGYLAGRGAPNLERTPDEIASRADFERWIDGYDVGIRYMDDFIARLFEQLKAAGVFEETLIVLTADHGENQGELNVYGDHQTADDKTCRVPLIVRGPDVEPGVDDDLHYHLDFTRTLCELAGGHPAPGWDGQSFADAIIEGTSQGRDALVLGQAAWACQRAARWDRWLLIRTYHDGWKDFAPLELYDLSDDPHETTDLSEERPDIVEEGLAILARWEGERHLEAATGNAGGNPDGPRALIDPLFEVIEEGGPAYMRGNMDTYTERLRATGREEFADDIERRDGIVSLSNDTVESR